MAGDSSVSLQHITVSGLGESSATLPVITGTGDSLWASGQTLPLITGSSIGLAGGNTNAAETTHNIPAITGAGTGSAGDAGVSSATVPAITAAGEGPGISEVTFQSIVAVGVGSAGQMGVSTVTLRQIQGAGSGVTVVDGSSTKSVPHLTAIGTGIFGGVGVSDVALGRLLAAAQGYTGVVGQSTVTLPVYDVTGTGYVEAIGTSTVVLPLIIATATGLDPATTQFLALTMHTETMGLTTYSSFPFNSFAAFNGVYLAAGAGGLFALTGATDDGVFIDAAVRVGVTDFGDSHLKRVPRMYVGYRADGDMILRVITDEGDTRDYPLRSTDISGLHGNHVKIGKGIKARYWQFELRNVNGADFELNAMEVLPLVLARRIGGRDA